VDEEGPAVPITFAAAKAIVYAVEAAGWRVGTYQIEHDGYEDATHWLVGRGAVEAMCNDPDARFVIAGGVVPLVDKQTGAIQDVVPHLPEMERRLAAMKAGARAVTMVSDCVVLQFAAEPERGGPFGPPLACLPAIVRHPDALVLPTLFADAAHHICGVGPMLEVLTTSCR
jgi:hypothetical protein